jgi:two-component system chemotaxis response regulator CheY
MTALNILVVDDSPLMIKKLEAVIQTLEHRIVAKAHSGLEALELYRSHCPDIVTMDIAMPEMDGIAATKKLVSEFPDAKVIMVTSHGQEAMIREALKVGAVGYVVKPVRADKLAEHIQNAVSKGD